MSEKIQPQHLARKAMLYVRQSSAFQGLPRCISFGGTRVDAAMPDEVLRVVQPAAIEAAMLAHQDEAKKQDEVREALERDLEAARYAAGRAQRQYDASDPENRLVTSELERRWIRLSI